MPEWDLRALRVPEETKFSHASPSDTANAGTPLQHATESRSLKPSPIKAWERQLKLLSLFEIYKTMPKSGQSMINYLFMLT